ncbi:MAG TPA: transcription termination factor Rho, partial [Vicinamibacteria bacterium]|nr:transcription termination factor Rho [Vicinamibacteria bacterium]
MSTTTRESVSTSLAEGVLELEPQGNGHLRQLTNNFLPGPQDVRVPGRLIARYYLKEGHFVQGPSGMARRRNHRRGGGGPPSRELLGVESVNGFKLDALPPARHYGDLVSEHPSERLTLAQDPEGPISLRVIDLITPIGRGQRGLIVAAPKTGKTILLEQIGFAIGQFYPEIHLFVLLIDERPEEVTHMRRAVKGQVIASTSDGTSANHLRIARLVLERSRRLVELGEDVVILLDSITRLGRAANREQKGRGKTMTG